MARLVRSIRKNVLTRRQYKNAIEGLIESFMEFIWMKLGLLNGKRKYATYWRQEIEENIEYLLPGWLLHPTGGFSDHQVAALEAVRALKSDEPHNRRTGAERLKRDYGLRKIRPLPRNAADEYVVWVEMVIDEVFNQEEVRLARDEHPKTSERSGEAKGDRRDA
jgi:hypothetical protein